ncbi:hypothetical protein [Pedobacter caeni]|uniref:Uncharacterized protein n=1 Tax=Pedobacter caeni TaxID=288992 RepID=A0A1M5PDU9_9SPHI|nr:hypothetical protein [Pedobacter caeni]SHG99669.1 hypothetical protein SAMN04488522_109107 [Pedobacter caeni]
MEKLNLTPSRGLNAEILTRTQLKKVLGGKVEPDCSDDCDTDDKCQTGYVCRSQPCGQTTYMTCVPKGGAS